VSKSSTDELVGVLRETHELLARPGNNFIWFYWDSATDALLEFDAFITQIESGDRTRSDLDWSRISALIDGNRTGWSTTLSRAYMMSRTVSDIDGCVIIRRLRCLVGRIWQVPIQKPR
jgi:hypothetical protein